MTLSTVRLGQLSERVAVPGPRLGSGPGDEAGCCPSTCRHVPGVHCQSPVSTPVAAANWYYGWSAKTKAVIDNSARRIFRAFTCIVGDLAEGDRLLSRGR